MSDDLISREDLKKAIDDAYREYDGYDPNDLMRFAERVDEEIDNAPTVTIDNYSMGYQDGVRKVLSERPTKGKWIKTMYGSICGVCGCIRQQIYDAFCSNCGADMRGGEDGK